MPAAAATVPTGSAERATAPPSPGVSRRVEFLRFVAIFLVMALHVPHGADFVTTEPGLSAGFASTLLSNGFGRISAPLIGLISGYFCIAILERKGTRGFVTKKASTLLAPLFFWNLAGLALTLALNVASGGRAYPYVYETTAAAVVGLTAIPFNVPLHYLADIFKCCLVLAAIWWVARRLSLTRRTLAWVILAAGASLYLAILEAGLTGTPGLFRVNDSDPRLLFRADLAIFFFVGAALPLFGVAVGTLFEAATRHVGLVAMAGLAVALGALAVLTETRLDPIPGAAADLLKRLIGALLLLSLVAHVADRGLCVPVPRRVTFRAFCSHPLAFILLSVAFVKAGLDPAEGPRSALAASLGFPVLAVGLAWLSLAAQDRLAARLPPGRARALVAAIP